VRAGSGVLVVAAIRNDQTAGRPSGASDCHRRRSAESAKQRHGSRGHFHAAHRCGDQSCPSGHDTRSAARRDVDAPGLVILDRCHRDATGRRRCARRPAHFHHADSRCATKRRDGQGSRQLRSEAVTRAGAERCRCLAGCGALGQRADSHCISRAHLVLPGITQVRCRRGW